MKILLVTDPSKTTNSLCIWVVGCVHSLTPLQKLQWEETHSVWLPKNSKRHPSSPSLDKSLSVRTEMFLSPYQRNQPSLTLLLSSHPYEVLGHLTLGLSPTKPSVILHESTWISRSPVREAIPNSLVESLRFQSSLLVIKAWLLPLPLQYSSHQADAVFFRPCFM